MTTRAVALSGVRWTAGGRGLAEGAALVTLAVTARLLSPTQVGHAALGLVVTAVAVALSQQGFGAPIVRKSRLDRCDAPTAHVLSIGFGLLLGILTALGAGALRPHFGDEVTDVLRWAAISFPLAAVGAVPTALLQRQLDFRTLAVVDTASSIAGSAATIVAAAAGAGAISLVLGPVVWYGVSSLAYLARAPSCRGSVSRASARDLRRVGLPVAMSGLVYTGTRNVDYAVLAVRLSAAQVGYYFRAFQLAVDYQSKVSGILVRMALPLFARADSPDQLRAIRSRMARVHVTVLFPFLVLLIVLAPELIPTLFGPGWHQTVLPTQILAVVGMVTVVATGSGALLTATNHQTAQLVYAVAEFIVYGAVVLLLAPRGIVAVSIGVAIARLVLLAALQIMIQRLVGIPVRQSLGRDLLPALVACLPVAAIGLGGAAVMHAAHVPDAVIVATLGPLALAAYAVALRALFPGAWRDIRALGRLRDPVRGAAPQEQGA